MKEVVFMWLCTTVIFHLSSILLQVLLNYTEIFYYPKGQHVGWTETEAISLFLDFATLT